MPDITYDVGRVSFVMKGAWNLATNYEKLDAVSYNGSLYIAKQDVPGGTAITNTTYWQLAVEKGDQGETGNGIASITLTGTAGNVDTYTITFTDGTTTTFTVTNGGVTTVNGRTGDVTGLAEEDGSYPLLNAGTADNLTPYSEDSGATQDIPFIAQGTGCGNGESVVDTGSYLQFKKKLGNTVGVNQLVGSLGSVGVTQNCTKSYNSGTGVATFTPTNYASDNVGVYGISSAIVGRKYIISMQIKLGKAANVRFAFGGNSETKAIAAGSYVLFQRIATATSTGSLAFYVECGSAGWSNETFEVKNLWGIDLTLWYGSTDRIPSDLLSHPENWGRYYAGSLATNAGTLESADGTVLKSIGRNCWDEETEIGTIDIYGQNAPYAYELRTKNYIPVIPNTEYFFKKSGNSQLFYYDSNKNFISYKNTSANSTFTTPSNCFFVRFRCGDAYGTTYNHDITISLYYPGESGYDQYYPYSALAEVDTGSEVLRSAGAVADEKTPDGTITSRVGTVDLGTIDYTYESNYSRFTPAIADIPGIKIPDHATATNSMTPQFRAVSSDAGWAGRGGSENIFCVDPTGYVRFYSTQYSSAAAFKTAMSGVYLYYELATPTTEQGTAFAENIPCDDFGSMYWTQTKGIPQGNEIFYPVDYKASIDTLYNRVGGDMSKIVTEDEYPEAPSSDGTYVLKATVSGGTKTYAWVAE